ncbi:MAG: extracellular solute-binding protein [Chloroflexi bacterium]|nr:MAG: extracellular solute-binding protein [Chloroflexota bacterium]
MSRPDDAKLSRRDFLKYAAGAAGAMSVPAVLGACTAPQPPSAPAVATPTPKPQQTLRVLALNWPQTQFEQKLADEVFTPKTGIKVVIDQTPYTFLEQRVKQLVSSESAEYDIYHYDSQWIGGFIAAGALERLDTPGYLNSSSSEISFDDFFPEIVYRLAKYPTNEADLTAGNFDAFADTPIYGLPWSLNCQVLWYRTDLISTPPDTWDEVREMAKSLTTDDMYGFAWEGSRLGDYISVDYCPLMWSHGGELWDPEARKADGFINSPQSVHALQFMRDMVYEDKSVDPASANWTISERLEAILQGRTAMALNWVPLFGGIADDPNASGVVGKIGFAPSPAGIDPVSGEKRRHAMYGSQGTGINAFSSNKEAAWKYLQWLLSRDTQKALVDEPGAGFVSARHDLREYAAGKSPWQRIFLESIPDVRDFWNNSCYAELLDVLQRELNLAYVNRKTPQEALDDAAVAHQVIYDTCPDI